MCGQERSENYYVSRRPGCSVLGLPLAKVQYSTGISLCVPQVLLHMPQNAIHHTQAPTLSLSLIHGFFCFSTEHVNAQ